MRRVQLALLIPLAIACDNSSGPGITLDVTPPALQMIRGDTARLSVAALDGQGHLVTGIAVSFESLDAAIATVTNVGLVHAGTTVGRTSILVSGGGAVTDVPVRVITTPGGVSVAPPDTTIRGGGSFQYRAVVLDQAGDTIPDLAVT
jgi:hypothetical protein